MNLNYSAIRCFLLILLIFNVASLAQTVGNPDTISPGPRAQIETPIAINPTDPNNLLGAAITQPEPAEENRIGYYYSFDGGANWNGSDDINGPGLGDPVVAFDADGNAYLLYQKKEDSGLYLHKSTDGGVSWLAPTTVALFNPNDHKVDRPWMAISPERNPGGYFDLYICFALSVENATPTHYDIKVYKSTDGGASFIPNWKEIWHASEYEVHGASVAVGTNGRVFLTYAQMEWDDDNKILELKRIYVHGYQSDGSYFTGKAVSTTQIGEWEHEADNWFLKNLNVRVDSNPRIGVDNGFGTHRGNVYVVWSGKQASPDILMIKGVESGGVYTWSTSPVSIDASNGDQWMPAVSVSPDGVLSVLYYSSGSGEFDPIYTFFKYSADGGTSFSNYVEVGTSFIIESVGHTFLGDYHGLTSWYGSAHALWCEDRDHGAGYNKRLAYFNTVSGLPLQIPPGYTMVTVDQVDESSQPLERIGRWNQGDFTNYKVPYDFLFQENSSEVLKAKQDFKTGTTQKYNQWLIAQVFNDMINHKSFPISNNQPDITGSFRTAHNATIQTELISAEQMNGGYVEFKDPWLRIDDDPKYYDPPYGYRNLGMAGAALEPYQPLPLQLLTTNVFKGVFWDQDPALNMPHYTIAAPNQPLNGVTYFLEHWTATGAQFQDASAGTTAVIFRQPNAVVTAHLKGHLASNTTAATALNNGRRVVVDENGVWHLVYEDDENIWYSNSTDDGTTWSIEKRVSLSANNSSPSIAYRIGIPKYGVVWDREEGGNHFPVFRHKLSLSGGWSEEIFADPADNVYAPANCKPAIIHAKPGGIATNLAYWMVCRVNNANDKIGIGLLKGGNLAKESSAEPLTWIGLLPGTDANSDNPTICSENPGASVIHFAWEQDNRIYYSNYDGDSFSEQEQISPTPWYISSTNPSISYGSDDKINIVWQGFDEEAQSYMLLHRQRDTDGEWGILNEVYWSYSDITRPSVGSFDVPEAIGWLGVIFKLFDNIYLTEYDAENWLSPTWEGNGTSPSISDYGYDLMTVWTDDNAGLPYLIKNELVNPEYPQSENISQSDYIVKRFRKEIFQLSDIPNLQLRGSVSLMVGDIGIENSSGFDTLAFTHKNDSINPKPFLQTEAFTVTPNMERLVVKYRVKLNDLQRPKNQLNLPLFQLRLLDANSGNPIHVIKRVQLDTLSQANYVFSDSMIVDLQSFVGRKALLRLQGVYHLVSTGNQKPMQIDIFGFYESPEKLQPLTSLEPANAMASKPTEFALFQNHPNPFNPSTQISFLLPEPQLVTLEVYDITGRKIRTLVNQFMEAGHHQIPWDSKNDLGEQVSSGVYIYQVKAGSFVANRKMMLVR